jgi:regulatory protein
MGKQITALKTQKRNNQRVNVYLDGHFAFGLAAIEAARLKVGQILSDEEIAQLRGRDAVERAVDKAMHLLSYRPRSKAEIRRRLRRKDYDDATIEETLGRLSRVGLMDDREFARYWVNNRFQFNPRGLLGLRHELRQKGVEETIIDEALVNYDEEEAANRAAAKAVRRLRHLDPATFRRKLNGYLRRRGFSYALIKPTVEQATAEHMSEGALERGEG